MMAGGLRPHTLSPLARERLLQVSTATLTSQLLKRGFRNTFIAGLTPVRPDKRMVGYAFTLRYVPAREDLDMQVDYDNNTNVQRLAVEAGWRTSWLSTLAAMSEPLRLDISSRPGSCVGERQAS